MNERVGWVVKRVSVKVEGMGSNPSALPFVPFTYFLPFLSILCFGPLSYGPVSISLLYLPLLPLTPFFSFAFIYF